MRKKILTGIGIAAALVLIVGTIAAAFTPRIREPQRWTVIEHATTDIVIDTGAAGDTTGDLLTFHNKLYNEKNTKVVGRDDGVCTRIDPAKGTWRCSLTNYLEGGQIVVEGPFYDTRNSTLAVTGGTGIYRNVRGQMDLKARAGGTEFVFHFELLP